MPVVSRVNPNFPLPGIDQSSKGFRDNFAIIKSEIEALQGKTIQLIGDVTSQPTLIDSGTGSVTLVTVTNVYRQSFSAASVTAGILTVNHSLNKQIVLVQVSNNLNQVIVPDLITLTNPTTVTIDLSSFGAIAGQWNVIVRG
jgi:tetrahydromethanopterin S-methyltransferase subunit H